MTRNELRELNRLANQASAALMPVASNGANDSHGGRFEPEAQSVARGLLALEQAGRLAKRIMETATKS